MFIIAGLGNPGSQYTLTRHNAGFLVIDRIAALLNLGNEQKQFNAMILKGQAGSEKILLMKPLTYMNLSGNAVQPALHFYKESTDHLIVISDDINLPPGQVRIRKGGSAGGHNGLSDIIRRLSTDDFIRVRCGVGNNFDKGRQADYVLSPFPSSEFELTETMIIQAAESVLTIVTDGLPKAMNKYNQTKQNNQREN